MAEHPVDTQLEQPEPITDDRSPGVEDHPPARESSPLRGETYRLPIPTTVISLKPETTWAGILEALEQAPGRRVVFHIPMNNRVLLSPARLRALYRAARDAGKHVALITHHPELVEAAHVAGIPTFGSVWRARLLPWWNRGSVRLPKRPTEPARVLAVAHALPPLPKQGFAPRPVKRPPTAGSAFARRSDWFVWAQAFFLTLLITGMLALGIGLMLFLAPWAHVVLKPAAETFTVTLNLSAHPGIDKPDLELGVVPARYVEVMVEDTIQVPTTGQRLAPYAHATGTVVFTNRVDREIRIPKGTRVSTATGQSIVFHTTRAAVLPAKRGARVTVPIEAEKPGPAGNVRAFTISQVSGPLSVEVVVTNPYPTGGGGLKKVPVVTAQDKEAAHAKALRVLTEVAAQKLIEKQRPGEFIPKETLQTFVMAETYDHFAGEKAEQLGVRMRLLMRGIAVDGNAARELALKQLRKSLPPAGRLVRDSTEVRIGPVSAWDPTTQTVYFTTRASGVYLLDINENEVRQAIAGKPIEEAAIILQTRWKLAVPPEIYLGPDWLIHARWLPKAWRERMPVQPGRILVTVDLEGGLKGR